MGQISPSRLIGSRPWRVTVEHLTEQESESGAPMFEWQPMFALFMAREPVTGAERMTAGGVQISAKELLRWTGAFDARLDPDTVDVAKTRRLAFAGQTYDITVVRRMGVLGAILEVITLSSSAIEVP